MLIDAQAVGDFAALEATTCRPARPPRGRPGRGPRRPSSARSRRRAPARAGADAARDRRPRAAWAATWPAACTAPATSRRLQPLAREDARDHGARALEGGVLAGRGRREAARRRASSGSWSPPATRPRRRSTEFVAHLQPGDTIVDGGNANFHDAKRRHALLKERGHQLRRRRHLGRRLGPRQRLRHDGRRRPRGGRAARADLPVARARGRLRPLRPARARATT